MTIRQDLSYEAKALLGSLFAQRTSMMFDAKVATPALAAVKAFDELISKGLVTQDTTVPASVGVVYNLVEGFDVSDYEAWYKEHLHDDEMYFHVSIAVLNLG